MRATTSLLLLLAAVAGVCLASLQPVALGGFDWDDFNARMRPISRDELSEYVPPSKEEYVDPREEFHPEQNNLLTALFGGWFDPRVAEHYQDNGLDPKTQCFVCTAAVHILADFAVDEHEPIEQVVENICKIFPTPAQLGCKAFISAYGKAIIEALKNGLNPDDTCRKINLCTGETAQCTLFPKKRWFQSHPSIPSADRELDLSEIDADVAANAGNDPWKWLWDLINRLAKDHKPVEDVDGDLYSVLPELRGDHWRGKDCNDLSKLIYPGRKFDKASGRGSECNGIHGDASENQSWQERLCYAGPETQPMGTIILGDSATAHFRIPPEYWKASFMNKDTFKDLIHVLEDELDFPMLSWGTGYLPEGTERCPGKVDSIYKRMRERNLCNHRDFQNLGVNGARSTNVADHNKDALARDPEHDNPVLLFLSLIGNDVCNKHTDPAHMTPPETFREATMKTLRFLDTKLPKGSHVVMVGVIDGRVIWEANHAHEHPLGDTTYADVYGYLNCMGNSPCAAWMSSDQPTREAASKHAALLNDQYVDIVAKEKFNNFDMLALPNWLPAVMERIQKAGIDPHDLFEPSDGFHPGQGGNAIFADAYWSLVAEKHPEFFGVINKNNAEIKQRFGDQGGY